MLPLPGPLPGLSWAKIPPWTPESWLQSRPQLQGSESLQAGVGWWGVYLTIMYGRAVKPLVTETRSLGFPEARTSCWGGVTLSNCACPSLCLGLILRGSMVGLPRCLFAPGECANMEQVGPPKAGTLSSGFSQTPLPQPGPQGIRSDLAKGRVGVSSRLEGEGGGYGWGQNFLPWRGLHPNSVERGLVGSV
eukprot:bmy_03408T0